MGVAYSEEEWSVIRNAASVAEAQAMLPHRPRESVRVRWHKMRSDFVEAYFEVRRKKDKQGQH